jgi:hypothetical protein
MAQIWAGQQDDILHAIAKLQASSTGSMESTGSGAAPEDANAVAAAERAMQELLVWYDLQWCQLASACAASYQLHETI